MTNLITKKMIVWLFLSAVLFAASGLGAEWTNVYTKFKPQADNQVKGPAAAYSSFRPDRGEWTFTADLRNNNANLTGRHICVYSASTVTFNDYNVCSGHSGKNSFLILKIDFSEPVRNFKWRIGSHFVDLSAEAKFEARYRTEGGKWIRAYSCKAPFRGNIEPPPLMFSLPNPAKILYLGFFADVPPGRKGFWNLGNCGTLTIGNSGSDRSGAAKPAVPAENAERFIPGSFFGMNVHVNRPNEFLLLRELGIDTVRIDFRYAALAPKEGTDSFQTGNWVIDCADLGVREKLDQLPVITAPPKWICAAHNTFPADSKVAEFEGFMYRIAMKYRGKIKYWEAMNEPDMAIWKERYVLMLKAFYRGVKRADPENQVVLAGFAGDEPAQLDAAYRYGAKDYFDILNSHSYTRPLLPDDGRFLEKISALRKVMEKYHDDKPLWVTEVGWNGVSDRILEKMKNLYSTHRSYSSTLDVQTAGTAQVYLLAATVPWIKRVYLFHLVQPVESDDESSESDNYIGIAVAQAGKITQRKQAFYALKTVVSMLKDATYLHPLELGSGITALVFRRQDEALISLWCSRQKVRLHPSGNRVLSNITDVVGNVIPLENDEITLSAEPIYLKCPVSDLPILEQQLREARLEGAARLEVSFGAVDFNQAGEAPEVELRVRNTSRETVILPEISLQAGPLQRVTPRRLIDASPLKPGESRSFPLAVACPATGEGETVLPITATFDDEGRRVVKRRTFRCLPVNSVPENFTIGDLSFNFGGRSVVIGTVASQCELPGRKGMEDCSARFVTAWNWKGIYLLVEAKDDIHCQPAGDGDVGNIWRGDSVQVAFDLTGTAQPSANVTRYGMDDVEIGLALKQDGEPVAYAFFNPKGKEGLLTLRDFSIVRDKNSNTTVYRVFFPWSMFGLDDGPRNRMIGMNLLVNDNDGKGRSGWVEWTPGIGIVKDASCFPKLVLCGK